MIRKTLEKINGRWCRNVCKTKHTCCRRMGDAKVQDKDISLKTAASDSRGPKHAVRVHVRLGY